MGVAAARLLVSAALGSIPVHPSLPGDRVEPTAAFSDAGLVVAWVVRRPSRAEVEYAFSSDLASFAGPMPISGPSGTTEVIRPNLAARGMRVAIAWSDASKGDHDVFLAISNDGGRTFSTPVLAAGGPGGQQDPRCAILDDGSIAIAFHDSFGSTGDVGGLVWRARVVTSPDGARFSLAMPVGSGATAGDFDLFASISGRGTAQAPLAIAWLRAHPGSGTANEIRLALSIDGGSSFLPEARLDTPGRENARPRIALTSLGFVSAFEALLPADGQAIADLPLMEPEYFDVEATTSTSSGRSFGMPVIANQTRALHQMRADVAADGAHVIIGWLDHAQPDLRRIVIRESLDGGRSFNNEQLASEPMRGIEVDHPALAVRGSTAAVVFEDSRGGTLAIRAAIFH